MTTAHHAYTDNDIKMYYAIVLCWAMPNCLNGCNVKG